MNATAWIGLLWFVIVIGNGIAIIRRGRRSGSVRSFGHANEDFFLLIISAIVLIAAMLGFFWLEGARVPATGSPGSYATIALLVLLAIGLTAVSNKILRKK